MFYKVVWQHVQDVVGFLTTILLQIYYIISQWTNFENRFRVDRDITMSMMSPFLWNTIYYCCWWLSFRCLYYTHTHTQPFNSFLSGTTRVGRYQKKHSPTHTCPDYQTSFIIFLQLQRSMASSLFSLRAWQSSQTTSLQVLFGLPLGLGPSTSYSMHSSPNHLHQMFILHSTIYACCCMMTPGTFWIFGYCLLPFLVVYDFLFCLSLQNLLSWRTLAGFGQN